MLLIAIYAICFLAIWWCYLGYPIFLAGRRSSLQKSEKKTGTFSIIVPTFNEKARVKEKIRNLKKLDYPKNRFQIIFVDGGSKDGTIEEIRRHKGIKLFVSNRGGKINDINTVLPKLRSDYVMITDADSVISENTLREFNSILNNTGIGAAGAFTRPSRTTKEEEGFWETNNMLRLLESRSLSASSVIAASYAFKRKLMPRFENDVIADDLFTTFKILSQGYRVIYTEKATAIEKRSPSSFSEMVNHKYRKARANIRETIRFLPFMGGGGFWSTIYPTKALQTLLVPFIFLPFLAVSLVYMIYNPLLVLFLMLVSIITALASPMKGGKSGLFSKAKILLIVNCVLLYALVTYPFRKGTSRYKKTK